MPLKDVLLLTVPERREHGMARPSSRFGERQKQERGESRGHRLYWGFCGNDKVG